MIHQVKALAQTFCFKIFLFNPLSFFLLCLIGGLSFAYYESVTTTFIMETSSTSSSTTNAFGFGLKLSIEIDPELCIGGGFGVVSIVCEYCDGQI